MRIWKVALVGLATATAASAQPGTEFPASEPTSAPATGPTAMTLPRYNEQGELLRPEGYEEWVFVGSSLGLSYDEGAPLEIFSNVYLQPEAYREYRSTGSFPEGTMLAMEVYLAASGEGFVKKGKYPGRRVAFEVAVKDARRLPEGWGYYRFTRVGAPLKAAAGPEPKGRCYDCHAQHAWDDNVFVQFYPVLRRLKDWSGREAPPAGVP